MRAVRLAGPSALEPEDRPVPVVRPGHALVRIDLVGLCGSDLSYFAKGANGDFEVRAPLVLGHEIVGTVVETAPGDDSVRIGDRVAVHPVWPCPRPGEREVGDDLRDEPSSFLGSASTWPHTDGGLQEFLVLRTERLRVIPADLPSAAAVLAEPMAVVLHALSRAGDVRGADAFICGAGPIGLLALLALRHAGARHVTVSDVRDAPLALARHIGADAVVDLSTQQPTPASADLVIEASGVPAGLESAVSIARIGGRIVQLGMLPRDQRPIALSGIVTKELHLIGTHRFSGEFDDAIRLLAASPRAAEIVTTAHPLAEAAAAFASVADPTVSGKAVVDVSGRLGQLG
ncbi:zinc-binding dehydrogenase [Microbacterium sp. 1.5R]|uniref:zinc-binding dehydrogenase n=1 Tax=Microbacterium sp. 1.5R TaxID=1916917 RepID=UPI00119E53DD|nr:zinc-binding dehydrogenase [Microbacterium sp. 1.5R]